jgi:2-furoyl-CoA dehydrogenase FAD binding subunit
MKPPPFDYIRAETEDEVLAMLDAHGADARIIAGGQTLVPMLSMRLARPAVLIDIMRVPALGRIDDERDALVFQAAVRQQAALTRPTLASEVPLLAAALPWVGHYQTRTRGTICGSVAHADEFISSVSFPKRRAGTGYAFAEFGRRHGDFAIVACAGVVDARRMRLAVAGVADRPTARDFPILGGAALDDALNQFAWDLEAGDDLHATARYRRDLVRKLGRQVLEEAAACRA